MALPWLRLYHEFAVDPLIQVMPEAMQRRLVMTFCFMQSGDLDKLDEHELAQAMSITDEELAETKKVFLKKGLIEKNWHPVNWKKRQHPDEGAAERMRKYRRNKSVTNHEQETNGSATSRASVSGSISVTDEEGVEGGEIALEPIPPPGPEFDQLGNLAIDLSCDLSLGSWVLNMARLGHTVAQIRYALEQGAANGRWSHPWLQGILRRVQSSGIPPPPKGNGPAVAIPKPRKPDLTPEERAQAEREARRNVGY